MNAGIFDLVLTYCTIVTSASQEMALLVWDRVPHAALARLSSQSPLVLSMGEVCMRRY